ncbi:hypothetical protein D3C84_977570 [compost metagenome]
MADEDRASIVLDLANGRRSRWIDQQREIPVGALGAFIAGGIHRHGLEVVRTCQQRQIGLEAPLAIRAYGGGTDEYAIVVDVDHDGVAAD